jgi:hypothetical protein
MTHRIVIPAQAGIHFEVQPFNRSTVQPFNNGFWITCAAARPE